MAIVSLGSGLHLIRVEVLHERCRFHSKLLDQCRVAHRIDHINSLGVERALHRTEELDLPFRGDRPHRHHRARRRLGVVEPSGPLQRLMVEGLSRPFRHGLPMMSQVGAHVIVEFLRHGARAQPAHDQSVREAFTEFAPHTFEHRGKAPTPRTHRIGHIDELSLLRSHCLHQRS